MSPPQDIWDVLETERTVDELIIRRAYARKLKVTNPEDDAEAFERLRAAYDQAMAFAAQAARTAAFAQQQQQQQRAVQVAAAPSESAPVTPSIAQAPPPDAAPPEAAPPGVAPPETALQRLQNDFQILDAAVINPAGQDEARVAALFAQCLGSAALENVQVLLQFERSVAHWLLMRRPASEALFPDAVARFDWKRREKSVDLPPDIASVLRHLRDMQFWASELGSTGARRRARNALLRKPNAAWLRLQMVFFKLDKHVNVLLAEIYAKHAGLLPKFNADALAWWRQYFSKPKLALQWFALLPVLVPAGALVGGQMRPMGSAAVVGSVIGAIAPVALIAAILLFKVYVIDWPKRWHLQKYRSEVPGWLRLGWFPAALGTFALSALLPDSRWSIAAAALASALCILWVMVVANHGAQKTAGSAGQWLLINFPLLCTWAYVTFDQPQNSTWPVLPALLALLVAERIGRGALFGEFKYGLSDAARRRFPYAVAAAAAAAIALLMTLPGAAPWVGIALAAATMVVIVARTPALLLSGRQGKIRYYAQWALWLPAIGLIQGAGKRGPGSSSPAIHPGQIIGVWLMAGVILGMAMVGYNQWKARSSAG